MIHNMDTMRIDRMKGQSRYMKYKRKFYEADDYLPKINTSNNHMESKVSGNSFQTDKGKCESDVRCKSKRDVLDIPDVSFSPSGTPVPGGATTTINRNLSTATEHSGVYTPSTFLNALESPQSTQEICLALLSMAFWRPQTSQMAPPSSNFSSTTVPGNFQTYAATYNSTSNGICPTDHMNSSSNHICKPSSTDGSNTNISSAETVSLTTHYTQKAPQITDFGEQAENILNKFSTISEQHEDYVQTEYCDVQRAETVQVLVEMSPLNSARQYMHKNAENRLHCRSDEFPLNSIPVLHTSNEHCEDTQRRRADQITCDTNADGVKQSQHPDHYQTPLHDSNLPIDQSFITNSIQNNSSRQAISSEDNHSDTESTLSSIQSKSSPSVGSPESITCPDSVTCISSHKSPSSLFPRPGKNRRLWEIVNMLSQRHRECYFVNWTADQVLKLPPDERPNVFPVTEEVKRGYVSKSVLTENKKLSFCWLSTENWGEQFRQKLKQEQYRTLSEAKREASRLWKENCPHYDGSRAVRSRDRTTGNIIMKRTRAQSGSELEYRMGLKKAKVNQTIEHIWEMRDIITDILQKNDFESVLQEITNVIVDYTAPTDWCEQAADAIAYSLKKELLNSCTG